MDKDEIHNAFCYHKILLTSGGSPPCQECAASKSECIFDPFQDRRRKVALQTTQNEAHNHQHILIYLVHTLQYGTDEAKILKEDIKRSCLMMLLCIYSYYYSSAKTGNLIRVCLSFLK